MTINQPETDRLHVLRRVLPPHVRTAIACFLGAWLAYTLWEHLKRMSALYVPVPVGDYWRVPQDLKAYQTLQIGAFWRQHNEHRIIFPEIVFALDMLLAHGRMIWPMACSFLCYLGTWAVLCWTLASDQAVPLFNRCCGILISGVLAFQLGSVLALAEPFLLQWPLMQLGVVLSIFFVKRAADGGRRRDLAFAIAAAVVATYSSANALLLFPLLVALGYFVKLSKHFMAMLVNSAIVFVGLYFVGYHFSDESNFRALLLHPAYFLGFIATYLSMPFGNVFGPGFGVTLGLVNLGLVISSAVRAWRARILRTLPSVVLLGFYSFTLLTIVITAAGRMSPEDPTFGSARVTRYLTMPFLNWAAVVLLCYWISSRLGLRSVTPIGLTVAYTVFLLITGYKLRSWQEANEVLFGVHQVTAMTLDVGLTDEEMTARIFPQPEFLEILIAPLKAQHLAEFSRHHDEWLGKNLILFGGLLNEKMRGQITYIHPVEHGLEVVGWANSSDTRDPFPRIVLANEDGEVIGWGRRPNGSFPPDWLSSETPEREAWVAFANLAVPSQSVSAYAVTRRGVMPIAGPLRVPTVKGASRLDVDAPLTNVTWQMDKAWAESEIPTPPRFGWHPPTTPVYCSWQHRDDNTGRITAEFAAPASGCVAVGVLHGPSVGGLAAQFVDADTGTVLGDLPFRDHDALWSLWEVKPDSNVKRVRFVATDNGKDWGQWLAVSAPMSCH